MNNGRDCPHGRQVGKCDTCDLIKVELELEKAAENRDALAAGNERLRSIIKSALAMLVRQEDALRSSGREEPNAEPIIILCEDALSESPQQHLAEIRAQAVIDAVVSHEVKYGNSQFGRHLRECAANIRQEPK